MVDTLEKIQGGQKVENFKWTIGYYWDLWYRWQHFKPFFYWVYVNTDKYSQLVQRLIDTLSNEENT